MNFLALSAGEITGIIGAIATVFTVFIVPFAKWYKKKQKEKAKRIADEIEKKKKEEERDKQLSLLAQSTQAIQEQVIKNSETLNNFIEDYDSFTTQNLKYMINDAFFSYHNVHDIPNEILINACECCDIYINKKHKNHEIKPRCKLLWEELERRSVIMEDVNHE